MATILKAGRAVSPIRPDPPDDRCSCPCSRAFPPPPPQPGPALAAHLPVARVLIESSLPHLDRPFDYSVPADSTRRRSPASGSRSSSTARNWAASSWNGRRSPTPAMPWCRCTRSSRPFRSSPRRCRDSPAASPPATPARSATCCAWPFRRGWPSWRRKSRRTAGSSEAARPELAGPESTAPACRVALNRPPPVASGPHYRNGAAFLRHLRRGVPRARC